MNELNHPTDLREYLLGTLEDEDVRRRIEERLMVDEEFAYQIGVAEDELIEEYLDGEMNAADTERFDNYFLAAPERKRQLHLTRDLRHYASKTKVEDPHPVRSPSESIFSSGWLRFAFAGAALVVVALGVWWFAIYESDTDRGLRQLQAAYRDRRPTESRLSGLTGYAPYSETRGSDTRVTDPAALDRASRYFVDATTADPNDAGAQHAQALLYLAAGDLERAERSMTIALRGLPNDPYVLNDAGAMYLELARNASDDADRVIYLNEAIRNLDSAIKSDPKILEARFNQALAYEAMSYAEQAKGAWRKYIELDSSSKWADEARRHLERLEREAPKERTAEELERDFVAALRSGNDAEASRLVSLNRELIRDKYLPTRLAHAVLLAPEEQRLEIQQALDYLGEIEMKLTGDPFAREIARFYRTAPQGTWEDLKTAHAELRRGYQLCLETRYADALARIQNARDFFHRAGDVHNARIADYTAAYALYNSEQKEEAARAFEAVQTWADVRGFLWLNATTLHWLATCRSDSRQLTPARRTYQKALAISSRIGDPYSVQRNLSMLALLDSLSGLERDALRGTFRALKASEKDDTSLRQRHRNLFLSLPVLFRAKLYDLARPASLETILSADRQIDRELWASQGRAFAGVAAAQVGDPTSARQYFEESREHASLVSDENTRDLVTGYANLRSADFERSQGNYDLASKLYGSALAYYDKPSASTPYREEAHYGLLLNQLASHQTEQIEQQILKTIELTEEYRPNLRDEAQAVAFFDTRANLYEIAAEFYFDKGDFERAYNFAETSSARTLLNLMRRSRLRGDDSNPWIVPLPLGEIRQSLPPEVRILQYSVFEGKTVVWIISRNDLAAISIPIKSRDLSLKISQFARSISHPVSAESGDTAELSRELYRLLIAPVTSQLGSDEELCLVPSKFLFDLPFGALTDERGEALISKFRLILAPSANLFVAATRKAATRTDARKETALAIGNPAFDRKSFANFDYLEHSEEEAEKISQLYGASAPLVRENATKRAFIERISLADIVHIAGHYVAIPGDPLSSWLLMAPEGNDTAASVLSNAEMATLQMPRTRLMVLSACRSGVEGYYRSEGMAGMSRTVLGAQVPVVVASQWNVDSAATSELMVRFHERRKKDGMSTAAALRQAQLDLLGDASGKFRSPYYWAAFAVYGGHAKF